MPYYDNHYLEGEFIMVKNKHLTGPEREKIEECLRESKPLKQIATRIERSASTVSREIRAHAIESDKYAPYRIRNRCVKREDCQKTLSLQ